VTLDAPWDALCRGIMAHRTIYTRVYSKGSAGQLVSAKGSKGDPLSATALLSEFRNHAIIRNEKPTALVSVSDRIIDTLQRAFEKHDVYHESPADIWIAFIEVPANENATRIHHAKELAEKCEHWKPNLFYYEKVFEWAIPEKYVLHKVSLQSLMDRGIQQRYFLQPSTAEVRRCTAERLQRTILLDGPWETGVGLGYFARNFGARAPLNWISHQLFQDCVSTEIVADDLARLTYKYGTYRSSETVDFNFLCDLDDGIYTSLCDWWLSDIDFSLDYSEFEEWRDVMEDSITWDLIDFWETWHGVNCNGISRAISKKEKLIYENIQKHLLMKHEEIRAAIEAKAVKMGL
jgi:hypothetical protein